MAKLLYIGHASFRLTTNDGFVTYIDPYAPGDYSIPADLVLVTHEHFDHNSFNLLTTKPTTAFIRPIVALIDGEYLDFPNGGMHIQPVPATNANHSIDECVGYVIEVDNKKLYFAGDTSKTDYMESDLSKMNLDYAFLPCDGTYNMDLDEAIECAKIISAVHSIPIHTMPVSPGETPRFNEEKANAFDVDGALVMRPWTEIEL